MTTTTATRVPSIEVASSTPRAPSLSEIQSAFQAALLDGDDAILDALLGNSRTDRRVLFGVYRHAYVSRLVEILRNDHPLLNRYVGDGAFETLARTYISACPSRNPNARWFSQGLPEFVAKTAPEKMEVAELAALERMVNSAFDAPDGPVLQLSDLASIAPEDWVRLTFVPHTSMQRFSVRTNAHALWMSLRNGDDPPPVSELSQPQLIVAWRRDVTPVLRHLDDEEAMMWNEASKGLTFGSLCELVVTYDETGNVAMRAAQYLQGWILSSMLERAILAT